MTQGATNQADRVRVADLRALEFGSKLTYHLPNAKAVMSARSLLSQMTHVFQCGFATRANMRTNTLTITKTAYKHDSHKETKHRVPRKKPRA